MRIVVVHHHFRPGGVRRVIEVALPHLIAAAPRTVSVVVLIGGEGPDQAWLDGLARRIAPVGIRVRREPTVGYFSEIGSSRREVRRRLRALFQEAFAGTPGDVIWAHNLGLGRNVVLSEEIPRAAERAGHRLVAHHHDWWFDNRWRRWSELRRNAGSLSGVARALLPEGPGVVQAAINREDLAWLRRAVGARAVWLPNPVELEGTVSQRRTRAARRWLSTALDGDERSPVWLVPCRFLRRKNIGEAVLLTRWLRPEAWLVTTAAASSADEQPTFVRLEEAAREGGWRVRLGVLARAGPDVPPVIDVLAASEAVVFTSILEGFGLPYLEAAAAGRPLIGRRLANVMPDLERLGFQFPTTYDEVWIAPRLFDWEAERQRQDGLFRAWRRTLPLTVRAWVETPFILAQRSPRPVPFSRLTFTAQLEVLRQSPFESWKLCARWNPRLIRWRKAALEGNLPCPPWPAGAAARLEGRQYGRRFWREIRQAFRATAGKGNPGPPARAAIRHRLRSEHLYPLLWHSET